MNIEGVRANLVSQGMKVLFSPLRVRKSYGETADFFLKFFFLLHFMCSAHFVLRHRQSFVAMANMTSSQSSSKMAHTVNDVKN